MISIAFDIYNTYINNKGIQASESYVCRLHQSQIV